jgi:hypothetical protein|tara:strand:- start:5027 stop:5326 length:300 start_codon:yes stop_codon:yes gene_type:complete
MGSKARHIADLIALGSRGQAVGSSNAKMKTDKAIMTVMGQNKNDDMLFANTSSDKVGIQTKSPTHTFHVNGDLKVSTTLYDDDDRAFKVYYANGDIAWG